MINGAATMQKIVLGNVHHADIGKVLESGSLFRFLLGHSGGVITTPSDMIIVIRLLDFDVDPMPVTCLAEGIKSDTPAGKVGKRVLSNDLFHRESVVIKNDTQDFFHHSRILSENGEKSIVYRTKLLYELQCPAMR